MAAGPLSVVIPSARAMSRQRGRAQHPFLGAGATVQGTQLHGWSPHWCDARCSFFVTAAWLGPAPHPGCWCYSAGVSAAWLLVPSHWCDSLCSCYDGSVVGPSTPSFLGAGATVQGSQLHGCWSPLTGVIPSARAMSRQRGWAQHPFLPGCWCYSAGDSAAWLLVPSLVRWPLLVLCHGSVVGPSTLSWVLVLQCRGLSCMAGPLTGERPAARSLSRQRGWAQHPFLGAGATVQGTPLHGWSPH
jgi:hypothetical protein